MKKILGSLVILATFCFGASDVLKEKYGYLGNYEAAKMSAANNNKPLMILFVTKVCPWCKKLENQTLTKKIVNEAIHAGFVPLVLDKESDTFPKELDPPVVPTIHFVQPDSTEPYDTIYGYKNKKDFLELLHAVKAKG